MFKEIKEDTVSLLPYWDFKYPRFTTWHRGANLSYLIYFKLHGNDMTKKKILQVCRAASSEWQVTCDWAKIDRFV